MVSATKDNALKERVNPLLLIKEIMYELNSKKQRVLISVFLKIQIYVYGVKLVSDQFEKSLK